MDPQKITELANLLRKNGDKILNSEFTLTLSGPLLRALNDSFTLIADSDIAIGIGGGLGSSQQHSHAFQVVKPINAKSSVFPDLQLLHDFVQKTTLLKLNYFPSECECYFDGAIDICKFRALRRLEVHKINICQVVGIQALRSQLQQLICIKSLGSVEDIITRCGGDNSNGFVWNELQSADFSYNSLRGVDTALEFAQYLQHLNLRHNKLISVTAIKWLPHLKTLDLSYNCLTHLPLFHVEACKRLQLLNISNNYVEELLDMTKLDALTNLNLSDNCLLEHSQLLPLSMLMTLTMLNLQGNPLACHPKHRLATAQYLHKNTATVKFVLDFEPLSKAEKALTGSQKLRFIGTMGQRSVASSYQSINSSRASINTPASSVGSQRSLSMRGKDSSSEAEQAAQEQAPVSKRRTRKLRTVDIAEQGEELATDAATEIDSKAQAVPAQAETANGSHLETKKQIETLRLKYGNEWLQSGNADLMLGKSQPSEEERHNARQQFNEFLGEFSYTADTTRSNHLSSTPNNNSFVKESHAAEHDKEMEKDTDKNCMEQTVYESCDNSVETHYNSLDNTLQQEQQDPEAQQEQEVDKHREVLNRFAAACVEQEEDPVSEEEADEKLYIVCHANKTSEPLFLTISPNYVREKDALSERTKTKWSIKVLESCERIKANTLRINFDTMQKDKQERVYCVENALCQELEKTLRAILSERDLTDMNITIYNCVSCGFRFTRERKKNYRTAELCCPACRCIYVAEVHDLSGSLDNKPKADQSQTKISPALIVEESPVETPLVLQPKEDNQSIGKERTNFAAHNNNPNRVSHCTAGSANSLNESSSCSKITNSQCSFDSNQSVVGSSNTERDLEFRANESDVDIISNPSQSSIEVLDPNSVQSASRKTSEERRISQIPNLDTIDDDHSQTQNFIEREFAQVLSDHQARATASSTSTSTTKTERPKDKALGHVQLTESSSSGSVTDSICTTYEQQDKQKSPLPATADDIVLHNMLLAESTGRQVNNNNNTIKGNSEMGNGNLKQAEDAGISSIFGALFQSTNVLMSSSKKLIDAEASASTVQPYKFNYSDFNDIDHRLKLYFYQSKFQEPGERFKWLVRGRICNEQAQTQRDGLLVVSTCKCYLMEVYAAPQDDVAKWLRQVVCVAANRLARIQLLPWKLGVSCTLRDWGHFQLLLQDTLRTDNLLHYLRENPPTSDCEVIEQPLEVVAERLNTLISDPLKVCAVLSGCEWICGQEKRTFDVCTLFATDSQLHIAGNGKFNWLTMRQEQLQLELSLTQQMSNLVEVERITDCEFNVNFLDETENQCELWQLRFETPSSAECCLQAIGKSWELLFGVPFSYSAT
ncbi:hypothetical protein KR222_008971 [Zaprionus bogoriensis]|nr:hypothetical protein KR222_008971 [Zaprionus bogoriensis]